MDFKVIKNIILITKKYLNRIIIFISFTCFILGQNTYSLFYNVSDLEVNTLDPIYGNYYLEGLQVNELIYSRLWTWKSDLSEVPDLSLHVPGENKKIMLLPPRGNSKDYRWRIKLKPGLMWPDGVPLTADDILFTVDLYMADQTKLSTKNKLSIFKRVKKVDELTIDFFISADNVSKSSYIFPLLRILPEHIIELAALGKGHPFSSKPMGSGPFQYVPVARREGNDKKKSNVVFERNNNYHRWSDESNIKYVKIKKEPIIQDVVQRIVNSNRAEDWSTLDIVSDIPKARTPYINIRGKGDAHLNFDSHNSNSWYGIAINCENEILKNKNVRKALSYAFNVDRIIKDTYASIPRAGVSELVAKRINGPFNPMWGLGDNNLPVIQYNEDKAAELLDKAGLKKFGGKDYRSFYDSSAGTKEKVSFRLLYNKGKFLQGSPEASIIRFFIRNMQALGIEIIEQAVDAKRYGIIIQDSNKYDLVFVYNEFGWGSNIAPLFTQGNKMNISRFYDAYLTGFLNQFNSTTRSKERMKYADEIHRYIYDNAPYIWMYRMDKIMAYRKELKVKEVVPRYFFTHIADWYFDID
jgi:ABC-type transport system substrate-binding protein